MRSQGGNEKKSVNHINFREDTRLVRSGKQWIVHDTEVGFKQDTTHAVLQGTCNIR